ncbi:MAG: hypothetical protein NZ870_03560, partial [bacterium]|nr:hypothetical protein [bacterium]
NILFIITLLIILIKPLFFLSLIGKYRYKYKPQSIYSERLNQIYGWKELSDEIKKIYENLEGEKFLIGSHYSLASILSFYTGVDDVFILEKVKRNGAYYNILEKKANLKGKNAVVVFKRRFDWAQKSMQALFERATDIKEIKIEIPDRTSRVFYYSIGYGFRGFENRIPENIE